MRVIGCKALLFVGLLLLSLPVCALEDFQMPDTPEKIHALANHYLEVHRAGAAVPLYEAVLARFPDYESTSWAKFGLARCYLDLQMNTECIALCQQIIAESPRTAQAAWAAVHIGDAHIRLGDDSRALELLLKAAVDYQSLADQGPVDFARRKIGEIYVRFMGGESAAGRAPELLATMNNDSQNIPWTVATAAATWAQIGVMPQALQNLDTLRRDYPQAKRETAWAAEQIGAVMADTELGKPKAEQERTRLIELLSTPRQLVPDDKWLVCRAELKLGNYLRVSEKNSREAASVLEKTAELCGGLQLEPDIRYAYGQALLATSQHELAAAQFRIAATADKGNGFATPALFALGRCLMELDRPAEARAALEELLNNRGEADWRVLAEPKVADCYAMERNYAKAAEVMYRAAQRTRDYGDRTPVVLTSDTRPMCQRLADKLEEYARQFSLLADQQKNEVAQ